MNEEGGNRGMANTPEVEKLISAIGSMAEMAHAFYTAMLNAGAAPSEARAGMQAFVASFVHESMESNRRKRQDEEAE